MGDSREKKNPENQARNATGWLRTHRRISRRCSASQPRRYTPAVSTSEQTSHGSNGHERRKASNVGFIAASLSSRLANRGRTGRLLSRRAQAGKKIDQSAHLGRLHLLAVGRHVAAAGR